METEIKIINRSGFSDLPFYATAGAAGMDLRAANVEQIIIEPLARKLIPTGLFLEIPQGLEMQIRPRSGLAFKHGITVLNSPGTIDADYRGEVCVLLINLSNIPFTVERGERIAQAVVARHERVVWSETDTLADSSRGQGGFGSTGTK